MESRPVNKFAYWDNLKGVFISLVVFAHCLYSLQDSTLINTITDVIYVFHMPAFVFVTGFLSKSKNARSKDALIKLVTAYIIFNPLMLLYAYARFGAVPTLLTPSYSYWFLIAMIVWRVTAGYVSKIRVAFIASVVIALLIGFFNDVANIFAAARIIAFYPFFLAGFMLPTEKLLTLYERRKVFVYFEGVVLLVLSVAAAFIFVKNCAPSDDDLTMAAYENVNGVVIRTAMFVIAAAAIMGFMMAVPNRRVFGLTTLGSNSMSVFLLHRIPTLIIGDLLINYNDTARIVGAAVGLVGLAALFGNNAVASRVDRLLSFSKGIINGNNNYKRKKIVVIKTFILVVIIVVVLVPFAAELKKTFFADDNLNTESDRIYTQITDAQQAAFDDDLKILFSGDLLLLEDQVKKAYNGETYDFSDIFEYTGKYIADADLAIGVFEGPTAGESTGYSVGNYDDGKTLSLNYPDSFASAVKDAGFDLVTTANNHLLDKGENGALRTLDVLDACGLDHTGSYRSESEKDTLKLLDVDGLKIAVLAYTYGSNGYDTENDLLNGKLSYMTSVLVSPESKSFEKVKASVVADIESAKRVNPNVIIVLSHMGEQFLDEPDDYQKTWNNIFIDAGTDIVLNDHTHSVEPVEFFNGEKNKVIVNCPGNFVNLYREHNGDAAAMVEIYIDKVNKIVTGASVVPMWIQSPINGNYRPLPVYDILNNETLQAQLSTNDMIRVDEVQRHVTSVMLGEELSIDMASERYYLNENGFLAPRTEQMAITELMKNAALYKAVTTAQSVCYVGDSVTEGTKNGGYGWYEPICMLSKKVTVCAKGGATTMTILPEVSSDSGLYVVAIGTNDVRYRDKDICAITADEYIAELQKFVARIRTTNKNAQFAFVAPWMALENDTVCVIPPEERDALINEYTSSLKTWCSKNGYIFSDPNPIIAAALANEPDSVYLIDFIHPNKTNGLRLYSRAVFESSTR